MTLGGRMIFNGGCVGFRRVAGAAVEIRSHTIGGTRGQRLPLLGSDPLMKILGCILNKTNDTALDFF